ncbi:MAG: hypothetical protein WA414_00840 [Acidobacteriaceae bacterium]
MTGIELSEETKHDERGGAPDVVVGIAGAVAAADLRARAEQIIADLGPNASLRIVFAWPGGNDEATPNDENQNAHPALVPYAASANSGDIWSPVSANQRAVLALAAQLNARACIVLGADLAGLQAHVIQLFTYAILERQCALAMPIYPVGKYDGLINTGILSPLSRTLYGKRVRYPLAYDFAASGAMCARLARSGEATETNGLLWPVTVAATQSPQAGVGQVHIDVHHQVATAGLELSAVLGQLGGSMFEDMVRCASQWQRVRGSQAAPAWGSVAADGEDAAPIDAQPMLDSFHLGSKNLDEVWRLVLPPNTMLELRRLTRLPAEQFRIPDEVWASIVYDFALAWRLRTISRVHLMGALTPLYLGWVASWVREVSTLTRAATEQRAEQLTRAWEEKKPYLLSRWRWPDRFNP